MAQFLIQIHTLVILHSKREKKVCFCEQILFVLPHSSFSDALSLISIEVVGMVYILKKRFTKEGQPMKMFSKIWLYIASYLPPLTPISYENSLYNVWFAGKLHAVTFIACWKRTLKSGGLRRGTAILALRHKNIIFTCVCS